MAGTFKRVISSPFVGMKAAVGSIFPKGGYGWLSLPRASYDYQRAVGDGLGSSVIVAPLRWLLRNFTEAPIRVRKYAGSGNDLTVMVNHPMISMVAKPNAYYSGATLMKGTVLSYELDGNAYWLVALNGQGRPVEAWYTPHTLVEPVRLDGSNNFIDYYEYTPGNGGTLKIAPIGFDRTGIAGIEDGWVMLHFRDGLDPTNTMKGMSGFRSLIREVFTDDEAANFTASLLKNMGVPGLIVSPADDGGGLAPIGDEDIRETKQQFIDATTGGHRGEPIIMTGPTKIDTIGFNPQQLNLKDIRRIPEERCSAVIGIPAIVCGLGAGLDRSTFANMAEAKDMAYEDKILPLQRDLADTLQTMLLPQFESNPAGFRIDFDNTEVRALSDDADKLATRTIELVNGGILSVAEGRDSLGKAVRPEHQVYRIPMNLVEVPAGQTMEQVIAGQIASPVKSADGSESKRLNAIQQARLIASLERDRSSLETIFVKLLVQRFAELGDRAASLWHDLAPPMPAEVTAPKTSDAERAANNRARAAELAQMQLAAAEEMLAKLDVPAWQESVLGKDYAAHYQLVSETTVTTLGDTIGLSLDSPDVVGEQVIRAGGRRVGLTYLEPQTRAAVYQAIADGRAQGWGPPQLERSIRDYVEGGGGGRSVSARATRIARTETMFAQNTSTLSAYHTSGAYSSVIAYDNLIGHNDADCIDRNNTEYTYPDADVQLNDEHPNGTLGFAPGTAV